MEGKADMTCEAERRGYKKVRITKDVSGWSVGSIVWHSWDRRAWNDDCSESWCHIVGHDCEYVTSDDTPDTAETHLRNAAVALIGEGSYIRAMEVIDILIGYEK